MISTPLRHARPAWLVLAACTLSCTLAPLASAQSEPPRAGAPAQPGAIELEFWRSAERLGTPEAYRAYLAAFPQGFFAALARAALGASGATGAAGTAGAVRATAPGAAPAAQAGGVPAASPALKYFTAPVMQSGAVTFQLGERFQGPGVLTVGWAGAKRQVVLPPGEWVVLAMADAKVDMTPVPYRFPTRVVADVGTLVLGRFSGTRLMSAMVYQTSVRPISVDDWTDIAGCQPGGLESLFHENTRPSGLRSACAALRPVPAPLTAKSAAMEEARASLARLGATVQGDALATIVVVSEPSRGYLAGTRLDWPGVALGPEADAAAAWTRAASAQNAKRAATVAGLIEWLGTYRKLLDDAYGFKINQDDLKAGASPSGNAALLRDFQPG
ncbi:MAG: hypothetical protein HZC37_19185 [Burkholderiales bacterium]|nr:hypothetical protein [Burkholderiales bacterium]